MPAIPAIIGSILLYFASHLVARVLISLGVMAVAFVGLDTLLDNLEAYIVSNYHALPAQLLAIASILQLGTATKIMTSAGAMRLTLQGLTEGSITKMFVGVRSID